MDAILGRPTDSGAVLSLRTAVDTACRVAYGSDPARLDRTTPVARLTAGEPTEVPLTGLRPNTRNYYRVISSDSAASTTSPVRSFHTARPPGSDFAFTITADSHLDDRTEPAIYQRSLLAALSAGPDFHVDLGDTFMNDKKSGDRVELRQQYLAQRYYFGSIAHSVPLFLVLGNHDGESVRENDGGPECLAAWSNTTRKRFFPNPVPDGFYTGNATPEPHVGLLQDYYAWTWGDALFIVLDPYWHSARQRGGDDNWARSLGRTQYEWFARTLEGSRARFVFVFIHQLVGGLERPGRGGSRAAGLYEWGGREPDGASAFAARRPGWPAPIHDLLVRRAATIVFHGHDHVYAKEDLDGIVYQEVPQPGFAGRFDTRKASEAGYVDGVIMGGTGHLRVTVHPDRVTVDYVQTDTEHAEASVVAHTYEVRARPSPFPSPAATIRPTVPLER